MPLLDPARAPVACCLAALAALAGCGPTSKRLRHEIQHEGAGVYLDGVPFVRQRRNQCGPAALASVAQRWGIGLSQQQIADEVYLRSIGATLTIDLARCARGHGLWSHSGRGSTDEIRAWLGRGVPVIALLKLGGLNGGRLHYVVVTGWHERRGILLAHTGILSNRPIPLDRFAREHRAAGGWLLAACPPERVAWPLDAAGHNDLALLLERAGKLERARAEDERAIDADAANPLFHFNLGNLHARTGKREAAVQAYRDAICRRPNFADAHNNLADVLLALGHRNQAHLAARRAVTIDGPRVAWYRDTLGRTLLALERHADAAEAFRTAIDEAGDQRDVAVDAHLGLIEALARAGHRTEAASERDRLLARSVDPSLRQRIGQILK